MEFLKLQDHPWRGAKPSIKLITWIEENKDQGASFIPQMSQKYEDDKGLSYLFSSFHQDGFTSSSRFTKSISQAQDQATKLISMEETLGFRKGKMAVPDDTLI